MPPLLGRRQFLKTLTSAAAAVAAAPALAACGGASSFSSGNASSLSSGKDLFRVAVLGDIRTSGLKPPPVFEQIAGLVAKTSPDAVLTLGDMVEADADVNVLRQQWGYFKQVASVIKAPAWYTPGNHDTVVSDQAIDIFRE